MLGYDGVKTYCKNHALLADGPVLHVAASIAAAFFSCTFSAPVRKPLSLPGARARVSCLSRETCGSATGSAPP